MSRYHAAPKLEYNTLRRYDATMGAAWSCKLAAQGDPDLILGLVPHQAQARQAIKKWLKCCLKRHKLL